MPWSVKKDSRCPASKPWGVINDQTGALVPGGCHATKQEARAHQSALYVNEPQAAAVEGVTVPPLVTIPGVDLMATGTWQLASGEATFTTADLEAAVEAAECPDVGSPIIKLGHTDGRFTPTKGDGEPAIGRVTNMGLEAGGNKIVGDLTGMPGWLAVISESAYPQRSIEGTWGFQCQIGHVHDFVITAVALLGVAPPGIGVLGGLEDVAALYGVAGEAEPHPAHVAGRWQISGGTMPEAAAVTVDDVRRAYYSSGVPMSRWITAIQLAPPQLIVADDQDDKTYRIPYSVKSGEVKFADPVEVEIEYVDVAASLAFIEAAGLSLAGGGEVWASAEESRDGMVLAWSAATQVGNMGSDPSKAAIKKMFALPADTKTDSSLPHHTCPPGGSVDGPDLGGCQAAIGAINGSRGGLAGKSAAELKRAYNHLAAHVRALGAEPAEYSGPSASAEDGMAEAAGNHGPHTGEHTHPHSAFGAQGGDATHEHAHTHAGDAVHNHAHASAAGPATEGTADMELSAEQQAALREKLGLTEDEEITAEHIMAALNAEPEPVEAGAGPPLHLPKGVMVIDEEAWKQMGERAKAGETALARMRRNDRDQVIRDAVKAGKFSVAQAAKYEALWDSNPEGTRAVIAGMARGVVPTEDLGIPGAEGDDVDTEYEALFGTRQG
jgi:hypothetical protein